MYRALRSRRRLDEVASLKFKEKRVLLKAYVDGREFRDSILELLSQLSAGIQRRLGFVPASARAEINCFIEQLARMERDYEAATAQLHAETTSIALPPPPPPPDA